MRCRRCSFRVQLSPSEFSELTDALDSGLAYCVLNSWTAMAASLNLSISSGGPSVVVWGTLVAMMCVSFSPFSLFAVVLIFVDQRQPSHGDFYGRDLPGVHDEWWPVSLGSCAGTC